MRGSNWIAIAVFVFATYGCALEADGLGESAEELNAVSEAPSSEFSELAAATHALGALWPAICDVGGENPVLSRHPSGVLTWLVPGGTSFLQDHYCAIGKSMLYMLPTGELALFDENNVIRWRSYTYDNSTPFGNWTEFQTDGNLVVYRHVNEPIYTRTVPSNTCCNIGYNLHIQEDGNVVIYAPGWRPVWSTGTYH
jgi:hypothetical protein